MRKLSALSIVTAVALLLSGCAQLPRSSEVKTGPDLKAGLTTDYLYYSPNGPTAGDDQEAIISGFLNAATGPQNDYQVAREYLTADFSSKWKPNDEVLIQESRPELKLVDENNAQLLVKEVAQIDEVGIWQSFPGGRSRSLDFKLVKENGQWRISSAPNATVLVKPVFDVLFKSYALYFYDSQNKYLVPDLRWFSSRVSTGTRLVNALIKGPNQWLDSSVKNSFPVGTKLSIDAVTVENGTAVVDLNTAATKADKAARSRMLSQLTATLNQLTNVFAVKIQIDHNPQDIAVQNSQLPIPTASAPMILDAQGLRQLGQSPQDDKQSAVAIKLNANEFGYSPDGNYLALKSGRGVDLLRVNNLSSELTAIDRRPAQLAPAIDNRNLVWTLPADAKQALNVHDVNGKIVMTADGWLGLGEHIAFGISREGARFAVLLKTKTGTSVYVAAIKRDENGNPIGLYSPRQVGLGTSNLRSMSWSGLNSLVAIAAGDSAGDIPKSIFVGGGVSDITSMTEAKSIIAQNDSSAIYLLDKNNILFEYRGMSWLGVETGVLATHYIGY